jgi:hypothetical protein
MIKPILALLFLFCFISAPAQKMPLPLNGNNMLGSTYNVSKCGLNYAHASKKITNRHIMGGTGAGLPATFNISGIPATCITIEKAYIYYVESHLAFSPVTPAVAVTNPSGVGFSYTAALIGTAPQKCWGEMDTRAYRVDVTSAITGNGNYIINTTTPANDIDGMTLLVIYSDGNAAYSGTLVLNDGSMSRNAIGASATTLLTGFTACSNSSYADGFTISSDFQLASHNSTVNGIVTVFPDAFYNFDQIFTAVLGGQTSSGFGVAATGAVDCFSFIAAGLYFQNDDCVTCGPCVVVSADLLNLSAVKRGREVQLSWKAADLRERSYFEVQRSEDGKAYIPVTGVEAPPLQTSFSITDPLPVKGDCYYRIKRVNGAGVEHLSNVIAVRAGSSSPEIQSISYSDRLRIMGWIPGGTKLTVLNSTGQAVYSETFSSDTDNPELDMPVLPQGLYILVSSSGDSDIARKFVKP